MTLPATEKRRILGRLAGVQRQIAERDPREWAHALRRRELAGEQLTPALRSMWRDALKAGAPLPTDANDDAGAVNRERIAEQQERTRQYAAERGIPLANGA